MIYNLQIIVIWVSSALTQRHHSNRDKVCMQTTKVLILVCIIWSIFYYKEK